MQQPEKNIPSQGATATQEPPKLGGPQGPGGAPPAPSAAPKKKPPVALMAGLAVVFVIGGIFGARWWMHHQSFVSTDDAQVAGDLVSISSRVPGHVAQLFADEGQQVKAGDVLAKLDDADFKSQLAAAEASLKVAQTNLKGSQTGVTFQQSQTASQIEQARSNAAAARAQLASAEANAARARSDFNRLQKLFAQGGVSRQQYEAAQTAAVAADAAVSAAAGQVRAAEAGIGLAQAGTQAVEIKQSGVQTTEAQIAQAQAQVDAAKLQLEHSTIYASANGIIARRMVNVGEQVQPGQGLFSLAETDTVWVTANIEETNIRKVHVGAPVDVEIDAFPHRVFHGKVSFVNAVTGGQFSLLPQNNASGNFTKVVQRIPVKIVVDDPSHELKPGMSAVVDIDARQQ